MPTLVYDVQVILGMAGYYSCFVPKYANKTAALTNFLKKSNKFQQNIAGEESFVQLKLMLSMVHILYYLRFDLPLVYSTDVSSVAVEASLLQDWGQGLLLLIYVSRKLNLAEQRYSTEDR